MKVTYLLCKVDSARKLLGLERQVAHRNPRLRGVFTDVNERHRKPANDQKQDSQNHKTDRKKTGIKHDTNSQRKCRQEMSKQGTLGSV